MTSISLLATCGLLYSLAATSPNVSDADHARAAGAVRQIAERATNEGQDKQVSEALWQLVNHLNENPKEVDQLAEAVASDCRELVGFKKPE